MLSSLDLTIIKQMYCVWSTTTLWTNFHLRLVYTLKLLIKGGVFNDFFSRAFRTFNTWPSGMYSTLEHNSNLIKCCCFLIDTHTHRSRLDAIHSADLLFITKLCDTKVKLTEYFIELFSDFLSFYCSIYEMKFLLNAT